MSHHGITAVFARPGRRERGDTAYVTAYCCGSLLFVTTLQ